MSRGTNALNSRRSGPGSSWWGRSWAPDTAGRSSASGSPGGCRSDLPRSSSHLWRSGGPGQQHTAIPLRPRDGRGGRGLCSRSFSSDPSEVFGLISNAVSFSCASGMWAPISTRTSRGSKIRKLAWCRGWIVGDCGDVRSRARFAWPSRTVRYRVVSRCRTRLRCNFSVYSGGRKRLARSSSSPSRATRSVMSSWAARAASSSSRSLSSQ